MRYKKWENKIKKKCVREDGILFIEFLRVILKIISECEKNFFFYLKLKIFEI